MKNFTSISYFSQEFITIILLCSLSTGFANVSPNTSSVSHKGRSTNLRVLEKKLKDSLLSGKYDKEIRPGGGPNGSDPTEVILNLNLRSIGDIDDFKMEFSMQLTLREEWDDPRLKFLNFEGAEELKYITISDTSQVWMPDVFFINEKVGRIHNLIKPNAYIRIYPEGRLFFSIRISLTLSCPMILALFPMDSQKCAIQIASYGFKTDDLIFKWKDKDPLQIPGLTLPRFTLENAKTFSYERITSRGSYSCLEANLYLSRNFSYYLIQMYIPCIMLVIVSWMSFYLDENAVPARTALGITTLLTMATQAASMKTQSAAVSYTKAMDVWSTTCLAFVFCALLEFAVVDYCRRYDKRKEHVGEEEPAMCFPGIKRSSKKVDVISRILFPFLFLTFNIVYWTYYLSQKYTNGL